MNYIAPYIASEQNANGVYNATARIPVLTCPSDTAPRFTDIPGLAGAGGLSYASNAHLTRGPIGNEHKPLAISQVKNPTRTVMIMDSRNERNMLRYETQYVGWRHGGGEIIAPTEATEEQLPAAAKANVAYADGHVETKGHFMGLKVGDWSTNKSHKYYDWVASEQ